MQVTKETIIGDILDIAPQVAPFFFEIGMHCLGCPPLAAKASKWLAQFTAQTRTSSLPRSTHISQNNSF
jgi:hypothetical protein